MNYDHIESLVSKIKTGDNKAKEELTEEFKPFIINLSSKTFVHGYEFCDIQNECYKVLFKCTNMYNLDNHRFVAYATNAIKNSINDLIRKHINNSAVNGSKSIALDDTLESILTTDCSDISEAFCSKLMVNKLYDAINSLNDEDKNMIIFIYFKRNSLKKYCEIKKISYYACLKKRNSILKKLRILL